MSHVTQPIYCGENVRLAYQLNWSLTIFASSIIPPAERWLEALKPVAERDGVRILDYRRLAGDTHQFFVSTQPPVVPSEIIRSIKGRLQHAVRDQVPKAFRRNYRLESVGEANNATLQAYVRRQPERHRMADPGVQSRIESLQYFDPQVDLAAVQQSAHGQYIANLHLVFENRERLMDIREESLRKTREMIIGVSRKKGYRLARIGLVANHCHVLLGCGVIESPLEIGLSLMNNLAYAHGMKRVLEHSFYVGTLGNYDRNAIRRWFAD